MGDGEVPTNSLSREGARECTIFPSPPPHLIVLDIPYKVGEGHLELDRHLLGTLRIRAFLSDSEPAAERPYPHEQVERQDVEGHTQSHLCPRALGPCRGGPGGGGAAQAVAVTSRGRVGGWCVLAAVVATAWLHSAAAAAGSAVLGVFALGHDGRKEASWPDQPERWDWAP